MPPRHRPPSNIFVSSRSDRLNTPNRILTPRTPHSRNGLAEEGYTEVELNELPEYEEEDPFVRSRQSTPPSTSPASESTAFPPGYRSAGDDQEINGPKTRICPTPLMFAERLIFLSAWFFVIGVFALFYMSFKRDMEEDPFGLVISYRHYYVFPLTGAQYGHECEKLSWFKEGSDYWDIPLSGPLDVIHHDRHLYASGRSSVCSSTVTYQLDGHASVATDLALMAQVAALAHERNSTFFVDDTYWNRGRWVDYFEDVSKFFPSPEPGCRKPPPEEFVACPRTARHWVVNSHTARYHLNDRFNERYEDSTAEGVSRRRVIYERAAWALEGILRPDEHTSALIRAARSEIASILSLPYERHTQYEPYIGLQLMDAHAHPPSPNTSIPSLNEYTQAVRDTWTRLYPNIPVPAHGVTSDHFPAPPVTYVATGSPEALRGYVAAQAPATATFALDLSTNPELRGLAPEHAYDDANFKEVPIGERTSLTRGIIVDLALLAGLWEEDGFVVPGATICVAGSNVCELAAVGLGWDRAFPLDDSRQHVDYHSRRWIPLGSQNMEWKGFQLPMHRDIV